MTGPGAAGSLPTLSVVMANYNHAQYVGGALQAILGQSARPMEVVVVDDASTDNSIYFTDAPLTPTGSRRAPRCSNSGRCHRA